MSLEANASILDSPIATPDASNRNVILVLYALRNANKSVRITEAWLKSEHGVGQVKQALRVLRFLNLIDARKRPKDDVLAARHDWRQFTRLLRARGTDGCRQLGVADVDAQSFGTGSWSNFDQIARSPTLASRSARGREAVIACIRALDEICEMDEEGFLQSVIKFSANQKSASIPIENASNGSPESSFPIGTEEQGEVVYARITFSRPLKPGYYRRLAELLQAMDKRVEPID